MHGPTAFNITHQFQYHIITRSSILELPRWCSTTSANFLKYYFVIKIFRNVKDNVFALDVKNWICLKTESTILIRFGRMDSFKKSLN